MARIENTLDLTNESPTYPLVPTSLCNPEIVLPLRLFREWQGLLELPPSCMPEPWEYELDGAQGLIDLSWSQQAPQMQPDDVNRDPRYSQYPYQEADEYEEDEEDMEVDEWVPGKLVVPVWLLQPVPSTPTTIRKLPMLNPDRTKLRACPIVSTLTQMWPWRWEA